MQENETFFCPYPEKCGLVYRLGDFPSKQHFFAASQEHLKSHLNQLEPAKHAQPSGDAALTILNDFQDNLRKTMEPNKMKLVWK